jgi:DNA-binding NarL/FixJ family response regulator
LPLSVLVVDDDPAFLALTARMLACLGVEIAGTAANATDALELVAAARPRAVLVDVGLPDRSGIDLAHELADLPSAPRVVLTSTYTEVPVAVRAPSGRAPPLFIGKEELDVETLCRALID